MSDKKAKVWEDSPSTATPITAAELNRMDGRVRDLRWFCPSDMTSMDEFDDDSIAAAWTRVDGTGATSGNVTWSESSDSMSAYNAGADGSAFHGNVVPLSSFGGSMVAGDAFVTAVTMMAAAVNDSIGGLVLSTSATHGAGQQVVAAARLNNSNEQVVNIYDVSSWGAIASSVGAFNNPKMTIYVRLAYLGSNTWRADASPNGRLWLNGSTTLSKTMTPTHVGFVSSSYGSTTRHIASYDFLRRVSGVS